MNTSCTLTAVMDPFHCAICFDTSEPPRRKADDVSSASAKSCHGYTRDCSRSSASNAVAIQWTRLVATSSSKFMLFAVITPGAAAIIAASHPRSSSPVPNFHSGNHSPSIGRT